MNTQPASNSFGKPELALMLVTVFWGATFLIVQLAVTVSEPFFFVGLRFGCATLAIAACSLGALKGLTRQELWAGFLIGIGIFLGYSLQTVGLQTIPSSKSAFITALYVPLVPLLQWIFLKRKPSVMNWLGIFLAFAGLALLAGPEGLSGGIGKGELLTALGALAIAVEIILISRFAGTINLFRVTIVQLAVTSLISFIVSAGVGETVPAFSWLLLVCTLVLGLGSAFIQVTMNWAQKYVSATRATLIYAGEPVWAGIIGRLYGERLPALALVGAVLIVLAVIISEIRLKWLGKEKEQLKREP
ncbi:MAG: DMT family transporter [Advenella sp.]|nr:DMT family transporter [Advenella sp.]MDD3758693.1 DMT family transporter [Advenella sp.]